jgi:hypothetical protein
MIEVQACRKRISQRLCKIQPRVGFQRLLGALKGAQCCVGIRVCKGVKRIVTLKFSGGNLRNAQRD